MLRVFISQTFQRLPAQTRGVIATCLFGIAAGGIAVAFNVAVNAVYSMTLGQLFGLSAGYFLAGSAAVLIGTNMIAGWLLTSFAPEAAGSGIPQLKLAFWKDFGFVPVRVIWVKFVAGLLCVGGGSSMGREGPSVQLAGALASNISGVLGEPKHRRRIAAAAGAAAGLAAAFNTPLAAVTFVLEEIIGDLNSPLLGSVLLASVLGASMVHVLVGAQPAFQIISTDGSTWKIYLFSPLVAAVVALLGVGFQKSIIGLRGWFRRQPRIPNWLQPTFGGIVTWAAGALVFLNTGLTGVYGLGYADLTSALSSKVTWTGAAMLLIAKFLASVFCYGSGGCGGVFAPTLFLGTMCGVVISGLPHEILPASVNDQTAFALIGMSAFLGAVVRAPVTSILIVFEMTEDFGLVPALMVAALVSQAISRAFLKSGFYEALLEQDGVHLEHTQTPRNLRSWLAWPVASIANPRPVAVTNYDSAALNDLLKQYTSYTRFPVVIQDRIVGAVSREEIAAAAKERRDPKPVTVPVCAPTTPIRDTQMLLVSSPLHIVLLTENERLYGLLTLHDLFRAESTQAEGN